MPPPPPSPPPPRPAIDSAPAAPDFPHPPAWAREGLDLLAARHADLARIEAEAGPLPWRTRPRGFPGLLRGITGQMISNQAAAAIWKRVAALPGARDPAGLLALPEGALRAAGFSGPKVRHAQALAAACLDGRLRLDDLPGMPDAEALAHLAAVPGMGPWTAGVHLLFAEQRADIFPVGDLALAAALARLRDMPERPSYRALSVLALDWAPHRSLAARLLWHWWRHLTGRGTMEEPEPA
jgi:DNA-3-methyladenine glycosylase II